MLSLFIGVLAGLGVGSGGLYLVYLDLFTDTPQHEAQGLNLVFFVFALLSSVAVGLFRGAYREKRLLLLLPIGMLGAALGALLSGAVPADALKKTLGVIFLLAGLYTLVGSFFAWKKRKEEKQKQRKKREALDKKQGNEYNKSVM